MGYDGVTRHLQTRISTILNYSTDILKDYYINISWGYIYAQSFR